MYLDSSPETDLITALGYLCLGSRLKRLGERMQAGVASVLAERGEAVQPAQLPLLMALHLDGAMSVNALSERVGVSQPGISRALAALAPMGLIEMAQEGRDKRQRLVSLTAAGSAHMAALAQILFPAVDRAVAQACASGQGDLLAEIGRVEHELARDPLDSRILREIETGEHPLDRPAWHALTGPQAAQGFGNDLARRFHPDIGPLSAPRNHSPQAIAAFVALAPTDAILATILADPLDLPENAIVERCSPALQMVMDGPLAPFAHPDIVRLGDADAAEMQALAALTEPGPFSSRTHQLGTFWGIRERGRLIAMAGERMRLHGYGEVSAVCVHPDAQGRGYGALMTRKAAATVAAQGLMPFLHVYADNAPAIATYQRVGFRVRRKMWITMIRQAQT